MCGRNTSRSLNGITKNQRPQTHEEDAESSQYVGQHLDQLHQTTSWAKDSTSVEAAHAVAAAAAAVCDGSRIGTLPPINGSTISSPSVDMDETILVNNDDYQYLRCKL